MNYHPWLDLASFSLKVLIIVIAFIISLIAFFAISIKGKSGEKTKINIKKLNKHYDDLATRLNAAVLSKKAWKKSQKMIGQQMKKNKDHDVKPRLFVLEFKGDIKATGVKNLTEEINMILTIAKKNDQVLIKIESGGGMVSNYGLAASQLQRIRNQGIGLIASVDKIAASGGYLMACVANTIIATPFAIIGSIGVLAQLPNFHRLLKKYHIDYEQITAGKYKRTLSVFGENTNEKRHKMQQSIDEIHHYFSNFVKKNRKNVDLDKIATGEYWLGERAIELGLVDELITSDDYLIKNNHKVDIFTLKTHQKRTIIERLFGFVSLKVNTLLNQATEIKINGS